MKKFFIISVCLLFFGLDKAFATQPIMITISSDMDQVIFDGKWTGCCEWKHSSLNELQYDDGTVIELRTAHQGNFVYVFADFLSDTSFDIGEDSSMVCFDSNNTKSFTASAHQYCFQAILGRNEGLTYQGGSPLGLAGNFKKIPNPDGFMAAGGISDENDRYTSLPHTGYEFRIPTNVIGRSSIYGFFFEAYDAHSKRYYSWPQGVVPENEFQIPSPSSWGEMVSPDKTLPEFNLPTITLLASLTMFLFYTNFKRVK